MTINDILAAVAAMVAELLPGEKVYTNLCPSKFTRPASLVLCGSSEIEDMSYSAMQRKLTVTIRSFVDVDEYHNSHFETLVARQEQITALFCDRCLAVGDRHPHVEKIKGDYQLDFTQVDVVLSWEDDRIDTGTAPLMEYYQINLKTEE